MSFKYNSDSWNELAEKDPFWAILTTPSKKGNRWEVEEFFDSGRQDVDAHLSRILEKVPDLPRKSALDFGCGVGRLTQGLAGYYESVVGVDIATRMIELAHQFNQHRERVSYKVNTTSDLAQFESESFDLVFSLIVLQHIDPQDIEKYLFEFLRVCRRGGVVYFQLPHRHVHWKGKKLKDDNPSWHRLLYRFGSRSMRYAVRRVKSRLNHAANVMLSRPNMIMTEFPRERVMDIARACDATVAEVSQSDFGGDDCVGFEYLIRKG